MLLYLLISKVDTRQREKFKQDNSQVIISMEILEELTNQTSEFELRAMFLCLKLRCLSNENTYGQLATGGQSSYQLR